MAEYLKNIACAKSKSTLCTYLVLQRADTGAEVEELRRAVEMRRSWERMKTLEVKLRAGMTNKGIDIKLRTYSSRILVDLRVTVSLNHMQPASLLSPMHLPTSK
jgi:hypothetical protein